MPPSMRFVLDLALFLAVVLPFTLANQSHRLAKPERRVSEDGEQKIPKLLHYIYMDGYDAFMNDNQNNETFDALRTYFNGCQAHHSHWDSLFWDAKMGRDLIEHHYAWFLPIWDAYDADAKRSDALRVFIMHHFGGLYLDFDIECYRPSDESFQQFDLMIQGTGNEGFNNLAMASVPGQEFWMGYAEVLKERGPGPFPGERGSPRFMTGTVAMTHAVVQHIKTTRPISGYIGGIFEYNNATIKVWPLGQWFVPCFGLDHICIDHLENEATKHLWDMSDIYGRHYFLESSPKKHILHELEDYFVN